MRPLSLSVLPIIVSLTMVFAAWPNHSIQAATFYVDDENCSDSGEGTETEPFCSLQNGIYEASSGDTVYVAAGTYYENIVMKDGVVIQGAGQGVSIIEGGNSPVVDASNIGSASMLDGFTITSGEGTTLTGMNIFQASPTVTNCTFSGNKGRGMYISFFSSPTVTDCTFSGNSGGDGAGMHNYFSSSPTVTNCIFSGNSGGGMHNGYLCSPTVINCAFFGNSADYGGGMYNAECSITVTNSIFSGNSAYDWGGGMYNYTDSSTTVTNCTFWGNSSYLGGGGILNDTDSSTTVTNSILWGNIPVQINDINVTSSVTYSDIQGGYTGTGNINADPLFIDQANGDFHIGQNSPCIDAGDNTAPNLPDTDIDGDDRKIDDTTVADTGIGTPPIVDMGADEYIPKTEIFPWEIFYPAFIKKPLLKPLTGIWNIYLTETGGEEDGPHELGVKQDESILSLCTDERLYSGSIDGKNVFIDVIFAQLVGTLINDSLIQGTYDEGSWQMIKVSDTVPNCETWDITQNGIPKFVTSDHIELNKIQRISKFRSGEGHDYSDDFESCRSMKHYYSPFDQLDWSQIKIFSPVNGIIKSIALESFPNSGTQVSIRSTEYPAFTFRIFHVNLDESLSVGDSLVAGQEIGTHISNITMDDIAVAVRSPEGYRLVSFFSVMTDTLFQTYQSRGLQSRDEFIISKAARDSDPLNCTGETFGTSGTIENWIYLE